MQQLLAWRSLHSQARGLNSVMMKHLGDDIDTYTLREAEFSCNAIVGFNFGDGHLHNQRLIEAIQKRCRFAPGEFIVVWVESEPVGSGRQQYWVMDAGRRRRRARQLGGEGRGRRSSRGCRTARSRPGRLAARRIRARQPRRAPASRRRRPQGVGAGQAVTA